MSAETSSQDQSLLKKHFTHAILKDWSLIVVSNRGPVNITRGEDGQTQISRSGGELVTALLGLARNVEITWVASALTDLEKEWKPGPLTLDESGCAVDLRLVPIDPEVYDGYYNVIANPLLWFLQHSIWDFVSRPNITRATWQAWHRGYEQANRLFATNCPADPFTERNYPPGLIIVLKIRANCGPGWQRC